MTRFVNRTLAKSFRKRRTVTQSFEKRKNSHLHMTHNLKKEEKEKRRKIWKKTTKTKAEKFLTTVTQFLENYYTLVPRENAIILKALRIYALRKPFLP